jgi:hypothetical protein
MHLAGPSARFFKCTCTREFTQENAYTKHQRLCVKGKKRLFSALSKAKDLLGSAKRARLDAHVSMESSSTQLHCPQPLSLPSDRANEALSAESSNVDPALSAGCPMLEVPCEGSSLQSNMPISTSASNLNAVAVEINDDSSLAQHRT